MKHTPITMRPDASGGLSSRRKQLALVLSAACAKDQVQSGMATTELKLALWLVSVSARPNFRTFRWFLLFKIANTKKKGKNNHKRRKNGFLTNCPRTNRKTHTHTHTRKNRTFNWTNFNQHTQSTVEPEKCSHNNHWAGGPSHWLRLSCWPARWSTLSCPMTFSVSSIRIWPNKRGYKHSGSGSSKLAPARQHQVAAAAAQSTTQTTIPTSRCRRQFSTPIISHSEMRPPIKEETRN